MEILKQFFLESFELNEGVFDKELYEIYEISEFGAGSCISVCQVMNFHTAAGISGLLE